MCYPIDEAHDQLEVEMLGESLLLPGSAANNEVSDQGYVGGVTFGDFLCSDSGCLARTTTLLSFCAVFSCGDVSFFFSRYQSATRIGKLRCAKKTSPCKSHPTVIRRGWFFFSQKKVYPICPIELLN